MKTIIIMLAGVGLWTLIAAVVVVIVFWWMDDSERK